MDPVVAICTPIYDTLEPGFWRAQRVMWKPWSGDAVFKGGATHNLDTVGLLVEHARQVMTKGALEAPDVTHLLWIDADMTFPPEALKRLIDHDLPFVGGLCFNRRPPYQPILCRYHPASRELGAQRYGFCYHYPPDALFEVDATGGAFILVKRGVFETIAKNEGKVWWEPTEGLSEDFSFCLRAKRAGYKIFVDTGLKIGHIAKIVIDEDFAKKNRPYEWEPWNPETDRASGAPRATIVIPTYNQNPRYLKAAVLSAAHQTVPVEVIVVDDGSDAPVPLQGLLTSNSQEPDRPDRPWPANVTVIRHNENRGISAALNTGIRAMTTDWFAWLSSDDLFDPRKIERQLAACLQAGMKASFTRWQSIDANDDSGFAGVAQFYVWRNIAEQMSVLAETCAINGSTVLLHKDVLAAVGKFGVFDEMLKYGQDWATWCEIGEHFFWYGLDEILTTRREGGNLTAAIAAEAPDGERRTRRDLEDAAIRAAYSKWAK